MTVEDRLMQPGRWSLSLATETPPSILEPIVKGYDDKRGYFGHLVITPVRLPQILPDDDMLALSRYTGILRSIATAEEQPTQLGGVHLNAWLGDEDRKGAVYLDPVGLVDGTFVEWITALVEAMDPPALVLGVVTEPPLPTGGLLTWGNRDESLYMTPRQALDFVCQWFDCEWRVNPDGTLDAGPSSVLFPASVTPRCIAVRKQSGKDPTIVGLPTTGLGYDEDVEDYTTQVLVTSRAKNGGALAFGVSSLPTPTPYRTLFGHPVRIAKIVDAPQLVEYQEQTFADQLITKEGFVRRATRLQTDDFDIEGVARPGDAIYVYDMLFRMRDTANQMIFRGEVVFPLIQRLYALTWPVRRGMGAYFRAIAGVGVTPEYTDVSTWVEWEDSATPGEARRADLKPTELERDILALETFNRGI